MILILILINIIWNKIIYKYFDVKIFFCLFYDLKHLVILIYIIFIKRIKLSKI